MLTTLTLFMNGLVVYSFVEYATHRWLLHGPMKAYHREHHRDPSKNTQTPIVVVVSVLALVLLAAGPAFMFGMLCCWAWSAALHWRLHAGNLTAPWVLKLRKHHFGHHRHATTNYGVSTVVWDKLFGTRK